MAIAEERSCIYPLVPDLLSVLNLYVDTKSMSTQIYDDSFWMECYLSVVLLVKDYMQIGWEIFQKHFLKPIILTK